MTLTLNTIDRFLFFLSDKKGNLLFVFRVISTYFLDSDVDHVFETSSERTNHHNPHNQTKKTLHPEFQFQSQLILIHRTQSIQNAHSDI